MPRHSLRGRRAPCLKFQRFKRSSKTPKFKGIPWPSGLNTFHVKRTHQAMRTCISPSKRFIKENMLHWEVIKHLTQIPRDLLWFEELDRRCEIAASWQTPTFAVRFTCMLATLQRQISKETLCLEEPERICRHVAYEGILHYEPMY